MEDAIKYKKDKRLKNLTCMVERKDHLQILGKDRKFQKGIGSNQNALNSDK